MKAAEPKGKTILVVEDDKPTAEVLRFNLETAGYAVAWAADGNEALSMAALNKPDLMVLDLNIPSIHGFELLQLLPKDPEMAKIPVVILSGRTSSEDIATGWSYEIVGYFTKPYDVREILEFIERVFEAE